MPDDAIRLTVPAHADFAPVASVAVRAAARQVALPETEIDRLRAEVVAAVEARAATTVEAVIAIVLQPGPGSLVVTIDDHEVT